MRQVILGLLIVLGPLPRAADGGGPLSLGVQRRDGDGQAVRRKAAIDPKAPGAAMKSERQAA